MGGALIVVLTVVAYLPAMRGGFIWDDDQYVTNNATLRDPDGLRRIWLELGAVPQYYPLVHSTYWVEHHLWGLRPLGYHVSNVLLHAMAALLLGCAIHRLHVRGAWLAAAIFALHPVQVESVAWITERKNVLSAVFYFAAALCYLRFSGLDDAAVREGRRRWWYLGALALFVAALLSKTVTCSLPAALLLVVWWKKGRLRRADVLPVLPFFAVGAGLGLLTAWMEKHNVGAQGAEWALGPVDRCLVAGRALWFYAGKLAWPADLTFIYPRWEIDPRTWWQWLFPLAAIGVVAALWLARGRIGRGPLVATLLFAGTLAPALGFFDVYPMRYSFVADHFQYLGCVGLVVLGASLLGRLPRPAWGAVALVLAVLTWRQARVYRDVETLWRDTLAKNPGCWMAHNNLGAVLADTGKLDEAMEHYRRSLALNPDNAEAHNNWGLALVKQGSVDEAIAHHRRALELSPDDITVRIDLGVALEAKGLMDEAVDAYRGALAINPGSAEAHYNLGNVLMAQGHAEEGIASYREALRVRPGYAEAHVNLGNALAARGQLDEAIDHYRASLRIKPSSAKARNNLGSALMRVGRFDEAIQECGEAIRLMPDYAGAYANLGDALAARGRADEASGAYRKALQLNPADLRTHLNLARVLAHVGRREEAVAELTAVLRHVPDQEDARQQLRDLGVQPPD
jgi:tetratricopeptide (TPR) repeat protein